MSRASRVTLSHITAQALYRRRPLNSRRFDESSSIIVVADCRDIRSFLATEGTVTIGEARQVRARPRRRPNSARRRLPRPPDPRRRSRPEQRRKSGGLEIMQEARMYPDSRVEHAEPRIDCRYDRAALAASSSAPLEEVRGSCYIRSRDTFLTPLRAGAARMQPAVASALL